MEGPSGAYSMHRPAFDFLVAGSMSTLCVRENIAVRKFDTWKNVGDFDEDGVVASNVCYKPTTCDTFVYLFVFCK